MTTLAPPAVRAPEPTKSGGGRSGPVLWMAMPAFLMFLAFGIIPLVGVLALSFTTWNGLGDIVPSGLTSWKAALSNPELPNSLWVTFMIMGLSWLVQTPLSI